MLRLVIVEDETLIREWLVQTVKQLEMTIEVVATARDGQEGCDLIRQHQPDLVLTDIMMPRKTGFEMFEATKDLSYEKIILSSYSDFSHAKQAMKYGVFNFLEKPLDVEELRDTLWQISLDLKQEEKGIEEDFPQIALPSIHQENWSAHLVEYIHQHYKESLSTEAIAKNFGYSESYLYKKIKDELGITLKDYLNRYRIKRSIQLLMEDAELKVYEVAEAVGFSDYNYFGKVFRKYTGLTFTAFRENFTHKK